jgi:hypothetical protein
MKTIVYTSVTAIFLVFFVSCKRDIARYESDLISDSFFYKLVDWNVFGVVSFRDTTLEDYLDIDHLLPSGISETDFCGNPYDRSISLNKSFLIEGSRKSRFYLSSKEPIIDFKTACLKKIPKIKSHKGSAVYHYAQVVSKDNRTVFLLTRSSNGIKVWLNGDSIYKSYEPKGFEMTFSEFIPINLKKGINYLVIKRVSHSDEWLFEGVLCDSNKAICEYQKKTTLFLIKNPIATDSLCFLSNVAKDMNTNITFTIKDLDGGVRTKGKIFKDSNSPIYIGKLEKQNSYVFQFELNGHQFMQPFFVGDPDTAQMIFTRKALKYMGEQFDSTEIGCYLYRLKFLLNHSSRKDDWWWKYKVSSILTELSNIFNNLEHGKDMYSGSFGLRFGAYQSALDGRVQRYLLITPDVVSAKDSLPLVVVIRPYITNYHHFLSSPQLARYWSLTYAKFLANKYKYYIMMPEARLYLDEPMSPIIESEIFQAINNVKNRYPINDKKIYLHGNCSAGHRCLTLACHHPDVFAAIGLYAPLYHINPRNDWEDKNAPDKNLKNIRKIPLALHYDPLDTHSPYSFFKDLISDCKKNDIPLKVTSSEHSGLHYNVLLVGEETFTFFKKTSELKN